MVCPRYCSHQDERDLLGLINLARIGRGHDPLVMSPTLGEAATFHSIDMAVHGYFGHTLADGTTWGENVHDHGYEEGLGGRIGEVITAGFPDAARTFQAFARSSPHLAALMDPRFRAAGVGHFFWVGSRYGHYWTVTLGSRIDAPTCHEPES